MSVVEAPPAPDRLAVGRARGRAVVVRVAGVVALGSLVVGVLVAVFLAWWVGLAAMVIVFSALWVNRIGPRLRDAEVRALAVVGPTRPADERGEARLLNLVEGLAPAAGLHRPRCLVIDDPAPNALALGRDPAHGALVFTSGLLAVLDRMQLEAVVAHALVRLRDGSTIAPTTALALTGTGRTFQATVQAAEPAATDLDAVGLTRYPPGLVGALRQVRAGGPAAPAAAPAAVAGLWLAPPGQERALDDRIGTLEEL